MRYKIFFLQNGVAYCVYFYFGSDFYGFWYYYLDLKHWAGQKSGKVISKLVWSFDNKLTFILTYTNELTKDFIT